MVQHCLKSTHQCHQLCKFYVPEGSKRGPPRLSKQQGSLGTIILGILVGSRKYPLYVGRGGLSSAMLTGSGGGATHHLQDIRRHHLHAAHGGGQRTHDGGEDIEGTHAEEEILWEKMDEDVSQPHLGNSDGGARVSVTNCLHFMEVVFCDFLSKSKLTFICLCIEASIKPQRAGFGELPGG